MSKALVIGLMCLSAAYSAHGQKAGAIQSPARLELTTEVAARTDEDYPKAIRITITNTAGVAVNLPLLSRGCSPDNGFQIRWSWKPHDSSNGIGLGNGSSCASSGDIKFIDRVKKYWVRLQPGEFMTTTIDIEREIGIYSGYSAFKSGTIEYWVEYIPPDATPAQLKELQQEGYTIPTKKLISEHQHFDIW